MTQVSIGFNDVETQCASCGARVSFVCLGWRWEPVYCVWCQHRFWISITPKGVKTRLSKPSKVSIDR